MKNSHFSSNYDFSVGPSRPLLLGGERTQQTNFVNLNNSGTPASNDSDVKITSVYQKRIPKSNYETLSQTSTKLEQSKYEGLNCQSETSNEYHVIRSTNKYQHKAATKRKRETGGSHFYYFVEYLQI